jgi:hypothetical protein
LILPALGELVHSQGRTSARNEQFDTEVVVIVDVTREEGVPGLPQIRKLLDRQLVQRPLLDRDRRVALFGGDPDLAPGSLLTSMTAVSSTGYRSGLLVAAALVAAGGVAAFLTLRSTDPVIEAELELTH